MDDLDGNYRKEHINGFWDEVRFYFLVRKLRRQKQLMLWESNMDKLFYESQYHRELAFNDEIARTELTDENRKPLDKQDKFKIAKLEEQISEAKAIKMNYRKNHGFREELKRYIEMIDLWQKSN